MGFFHSTCHECAITFDNVRRLKKVQEKEISLKATKISQNLLILNSLIFFISVSMLVVKGSLISMSNGKDP